MKDKVLEFIRYAKENNLPIESIVLSDKNGIIVKERFALLRSRNIFSHTKSFITVGCFAAISQGLLSLDDHLVDSIKEKISQEQYKKYYDVTLNHLLNMVSGIGKGELFKTFTDLFPKITDYTDYLLHCEKVPSGSRFVYSNGDTYLAALMLEHAVGSINEFLYLNVFKKMDIPYPIIATCPFGHVIGATGLVLSIEDMNKMGILMLNKGTYNGNVIFDSSYMPLIESLKYECDLSSKYNQYFSYNFWKFKDGYRADGAFGQITYIFPKSNYALSIQCPEYGNLDLVLKALYKIVFDEE